MEVSFVRVERQSEAIVHHDRGRVFRVRAPGALRESPPHDLGHFIVERELGWQTGFWGYVARGVLFPGIEQLEGARRFHQDEHTRAALAGAKDLLTEAEGLADVIRQIARGSLDRDPGRVVALLARAWWPPHSRVRELPIADLARACRAFRQADADWRALALGDRLRYRWTSQRHPLAPENPLDVRPLRRRG